MTTSATISILAPHDTQAEILRLFKLPSDKMRQELGGDVNVPLSGAYLRPEFCIDHINLYYINGVSGDSWRYDMALVAKKYPEVQILYKEMIDDGKAGGATNDCGQRFFTPYAVMVENHTLGTKKADVDLPAVRRCCSEIWTKQNNGFLTHEQAEHFIDVMRATFPALDKWVSDGDIDLWICHFTPETFDPDAEIAKLDK